MIYLLWGQGSPFVKVGMAADVSSRMKSLQTGCPFDLVLISMVEGAEQEEAQAHQLLFPAGKRGEWFDVRHWRKVPAHNRSCLVSMFLPGIQKQSVLLMLDSFLPQMPVRLAEVLSSFACAGSESSEYLESLLSLESAKGYELGVKMAEASLNGQIKAQQDVAKMRRDMGLL